MVAAAAAAAMGEAAQDTAMVQLARAHHHHQAKATRYRVGLLVVAAPMHLSQWPASLTPPWFRMAGVGASPRRFPAVCHLSVAIKAEAHVSRCTGQGAFAPYVLPAC